ncbi:Ig-like domain-containing protein [Pseudomonas sp. SDO5271_S396]
MPKKTAESEKDGALKKKQSAKSASSADTPKKQALAKTPSSSSKKKRRITDLDSPYTSPLQVFPVEDHNYGLGIRHIEEGLDYVFDRWTNLNVGDTYRIWMNGIRMAQDTVKLEEASAPRFYLNIPSTTLLFGTVVNVYGEVERVGSGTISSSPPLRVFLKKTRPGGADDRPDQNWHSKLVLTLSETFIDSVVASRGITGTIKHWEHMRKNDLVMFYWGEHRLDLAPVTADQVGHDYVFDIPPSFLSLAGCGHFVAQFYLYDEVRNRSGELQPWSKPVPVTVDLDITLLDEPIIIEADQDTLVLDAEALGRNPATAEVDVRRNGPFRLYDWIELEVHGTTPEGEDVSTRMRQEVVRVPQYYEFPIANEFVRSLIQSTITVSYVRIRTGADDLSSRKSTYTVAGMRYVLPKPSVDQAHGPFIPADLSFITARMPNYQPPGNAGDELKVEIVGQYIDGSVERRTSVRSAGVHPRLRDIFKADYEVFEGLRDTHIYYEVRDSSEIRESERLYVQIGRPIRELRAPTIREAINNNVDPENIGSVGTLELLEQFNSGDVVVVQYTGSVTGTEAFSYIVGVASNPFIADVPKRLFTDNNDGTLTVSYTRERFGQTQLSEELVVTIGKALGELFEPEVLGADPDLKELDPDVAWPAGVTVRVSYEHIKRNDKVKVCWCGLSGLGSYFDIKENQSGTYIDFTVPAETVGFNIHPLGRPIEVYFVVIRNGFETQSPVLTLQLLTLRGLSGPKIDSIGENAVLEIPLLQDFDETRVAPWRFARLGQRLWLHYKGTRSSGADYDNYVFLGRAINAEQVISGITSETPVLALRNLKEWTELTITFLVTFDHSNEQMNAVPFDVRHHMVQLVANTYPHPAIKDSTPATGASVTVDPLVIQNKCQVLVSYPNMNVGGTDRITLYWIREDGLALEVATTDGLAGGTVTFNINNDYPAQSINSTVRLQYTAVLGRGGSAESEEQTVRVGTIAAGSLPRALINSVAHGGTLVPASLTGDAMLALNKWIYSRTGQTVWIEITGTGVGSRHLLTAYKINSSEQANGLRNIPVPRSFLMSVPNNGSVRVLVHVNFTGSTDKSKAVAFNVTDYSVRHTSPLDFNQTSVYLSGRTYLLNGNSTLPNFNSSNSITRTASGGTPGYTYRSSNTNVAVVTTSGGYVTVRGNGSATITVTDNSVPAQVRSYIVYVSNVVYCYGLGRNHYTGIVNEASRQGVRLANIYELRELSAAYGAHWPMGNDYYWSSTYSHNFLLFNYYYGRNINTGAEATFKQWVGSQLLGVGLR